MTTNGQTSAVVFSCMNVPYGNHVYIVPIGFFTIRKSDTFLSDYLTDLKLHSTK